MTRTDYMNANHADRDAANTAHRAYYGQYVNRTVIALVALHIGTDTIRASVDRDQAFNDIPLARWDRLVPLLGGAVPALKANGDYLTLCVGGCILKEAARQIREGAAL